MRLPFRCMMHLKRLTCPPLPFNDHPYEQLHFIAFRTLSEDSAGVRIGILLVEAQESEDRTEGTTRTISSFSKYAQEI